MIAEKDLLSLEFYKKSPYTGSSGKMCFRIEKVEVPVEPEEPVSSEENEVQASNSGDEEKPAPMEKRLQATIWKGPYAFAHTKEKKTSHQEAFSKEGISAICSWLNEQAKIYNA
jgi:hypothetical protein